MDTIKVFTIKYDNSLREQIPKSEVYTHLKGTLYKVNDEEKFVNVLMEHSDRIHRVIEDVIWFTFHDWKVTLKYTKQVLRYMDNKLAMYCISDRFNNLKETINCIMSKEQFELFLKNHPKITKRLKIEK